MGGCCSTSGSEAPLINSPNSSANSKQRKEDKIELAFKAKRANVFTEAIDIGRGNFTLKKIFKSDAQGKTICKCAFI